ncbi:TIGR00730 family Rossman fold protein [Methyloligella sp. GL2]|nr:TIGR00730 family Rossman fold protein [Methyloligella sp. GL2]
MAAMVEVSPIQRVCVYCGSGAGENPAYAVAARQLGTILADNGIGLVYGGGCIGLMGEVARAVLEAGGHVTGIIPGFLTEREIMLKDVQDLIVVEGMHERKHLMFDKSDAFVALPGGIGTLEELVEQLTWAQLGRHEKPVVLANIEGFWDPLLRLFAHMQENSFIRRDAALKLAVIDQVQDILPAIEKHMRPRAEEAEAEAIDIKF